MNGRPKWDSKRVIRDILDSKKKIELSSISKLLVFNGMVDFHNFGAIINVEVKLSPQFHAMQFVPPKIVSRGLRHKPLASTQTGGILALKHNNGKLELENQVLSTGDFEVGKEVKEHDGNLDTENSTEESCQNIPNKHQKDTTMATEVQAAPAHVIVDGASESFVNKVSNIPVVASTMGQVSNMYNWTKESNSVVRYTLEAAEKSVAVAASTAKPVYDRLEKPISLANDVACKQLDTLQTKLPIIGEPTEKVVSTIQDSTWNVIENTKKVGTDKVNDLLNTRMGKVVTTSMDMALTASDYAIEYYLPPDEEEKMALEEEEDNEDEDQDKQVELQPTDVSIKKMGKVSNKLRKRLYNRALKNIQYAQKRSHETVEKLQFTVNLIDYAKSNIDTANHAIRTRVESTQSTLWTTWNDWTTEDGEGHGENVGDENVDEKNGEQRTLAIARNLAGRLRVLSHNVAASMSVLPENLRSRVEEARDLADSVYKSFEEAQYFSDLPSNLLTRAREQLDSLQETSKVVADYLINSPPLQWLVPNQVRHYFPHQNGKEAISNETERNGVISQEQ